MVSELQPDQRPRFASSIDAPVHSWAAKCLLAFAFTLQPFLQLLAM